MGILLVCVLLSGCAQDRASVKKNLMSDREATARNQGVPEHYLVGCPDVVEIEVSGRRELDLKQAVGPDGRLDLGPYGKPRVEGRTPKEIAAVVADELGMPVREVQVQVTSYRSQQIFLFGQVVGWQRTVPYQGQETVLDLLQRVGGITRGAEPNDVYVARAHVADGGRPEVFHVDLQAIVLKGDQRTNLRLLPDDQVYVGETRQARIERNIPPVLRPLYRTFWNTRPASLDPRQFAETPFRFPRIAALREEQNPPERKK